MNMKKVIKAVFVILLFTNNFNAGAQAPIKKDTIAIGDSVAYPKLQEGKKYFAIYKGKKIRATKKDSGKRAFVIYNVNVAGERRISKVYYNN